MMWARMGARRGVDTVSAATCATPPDCAAVHAAAVGGACLAVALPHGAPRRTVFLATQHSLQCAGPTPRPSGVVRQAGHFPGFADLARCRPAEVLSEGLREITNDRRKSDPAQETHVGLRTQQSNLSLPVQLTVYPEVRTNSTIVYTNSIGWKPGALVFPFTSNRPTGIAPANTRAPGFHSPRWARAALPQRPLCAQQPPIATKIN